MLAVQFDLFEDNSPVGILKRENENLRISLANIRKGVFSRYHDLEKKVISLQEQVERLQALVIQTKI